MKAKKIGSILLAAALALTALSACSGSEAGSAPAQSSRPSSSQGAVSSKETPAADDEPVTVEILHYIGNTVHFNAFNKILDQYREQHPNVTFDSQGMAKSDFISQIRTRFAAGDIPDLINGNPALFPDLIETGYLMDLTGNALIDNLNLTDADLNDCSYNGVVYAIPVDFKVYGMYYNKDIFEQYQLEVPTSQKELLDICQTLADNGVDPFMRNYATPVYVDTEMRSMLWPLLQANGKFDAFEKIMAGEAKWADYPEFETALRTWSERMAYYRTDDMSNDFSMGREKFANGEAAMALEGIWSLGNILQFNPDIRIGMFPVPREDGKPNQYGFEMNNLFMISNENGAADQCLDFMAYWLQPDIAAYWATETCMPSVVPGVDAELPEVIETAMQAKQDGQIAHAGLWTAQLYGEFQTTWEAMLQAYAADRDFDTAKFTAKFQDAYDEIIKSR